MTRAVILAGGFGTRLRPLTATVPKAMIPLVNRPVIDYILDYLAGYGLNDIVITTNYLREQTIEYLTRRRVGLTIAYPEEPAPLGTAGSVKNAAISERMLVIQGDNITEIDLRHLLRFHDEHGGLVTIALLPVLDPSLFGIAQLAATGKILQFKEKPAPGECFSNLANTGLYILEPEALELVPSDRAFDFSKDLFPRLVARGEVYGCVVEGFWADVGNLEGYLAASRWILEKGDFRCADTAEIDDCDIQGNVAIGEHARVDASVVRGPAVIGSRATLRKSKLYSSVVLPGALLADTTLHNSIIQQNAVIEGEEIVNCIR
ncbi:MAG TPA: NDP-sugar synthase [Methanomicrobia archaeon]|nr:NDP-sugar synthase [Methanomicrobia archaeon]